MSALSNIPLTISVQGRILGLAALRCKNEQANYATDASDDLDEPVVAINPITLGFISSNRLCMPSQVKISAFLLHVVSFCKGAFFSIFRYQSLAYFHRSFLYAALYNLLSFVPAVYK